MTRHDSGDATPSTLPENPCKGHSCPSGQECHLLRRPCILFCPLLARCRDSPPKHPLGREDLPMSLQAGASRGGVRRGSLPPEDIRSLVKGLSTAQIVQRPFFPKLQRYPANLAVTRKSTSHHAPLVFISTSKVTTKFFTTSIKLSKDIKPQFNEKKFISAPGEKIRLGGRHGQTSTQTAFSQVLPKDKQSRKQCYRVPGPGEIPALPNEKMEISFPSSRLVQRMERPPPRLGRTAHVFVFFWQRKERSPPRLVDTQHSD